MSKIVWLTQGQFTVVDDANIKLNGRQRKLGRFKTPELAHAAYCRAALELHGDFSRALSFR